MRSYLTLAELLAVDALHKRTTYIIASISSGILSLARAGMQLNVESYTYIPATDECVRNDVLRFLQKLRKSAAKTMASQLGLDL